MEISLLRRYATLAASVLLLLLFGSCEETVDPFVGEARPFTIWGYLESTADTQKVRVFTIEERIGVDRSGPIDATVSSVDLDTGERRVWRDSLVTFGEDHHGHVFWSAFRPVPGHRYRLEVARSDGATSHAEVTVPPLVEVEVPEEIRTFAFPVMIRGTAPNLVRLGVTYESVAVYPQNPWPIGTPRPEPIVFPVTVPYEQKARRTEGGWTLDVNMREDFAVVADEFLRQCLPQEVALRRMEFHFLAADESWRPPGGDFDPDVISEPGTFNNVENGWGYFGAGQKVSVRWIPPTNIQSLAGFTQAAPCAMSPNPNCLVREPCFRCDEELPPDIRRQFCSGDA